MKMQQGYQIIEPTSLVPLLGNQSQAPFAVAVLEWTIDRLRIQSPALFDEVSVEVIPVSYLGVYPAIGIRYKRESANDLEPIISDGINAIIERLSFSNFLSFIEDSSIAWGDVWKEMKGTL